jgi:GTP pyrophosphokinase
VEGLTKISGGIFAGAVSTQAENMRKLLLTMSDDIRVILIKIADRLHNMRTLGAQLPAKQYKIAGETMFLYAPMAHRLGLFSIKSELEDLSFRYEHPEDYKQIAQKLEATAANREKMYEHFAVPLEKSLDKLDYHYKMQVRVKSIYSIWNKMRMKNIEFEAIYDLFAVRIVFESKDDMDVKRQCWEIYSAVTDLYELRPDRIRDWISRPKANGYQALHLTVMGPDGQWIEVQIRTTKMDEIAEKGFAAHWKYKEYNAGNTTDHEQTELDLWLARIQDILEAPSPNAMDFLDTIKLNLYASEIFVFTPKGDIKTLPQSATALDFAYEIHTNVGDYCIGAKVNHKLVPLSHKLSSGDQVEILTSRSQFPKEEWLHFVTTAKAKTKIESALKKQKKEFIKRGEKSFQDCLEKSGLEPTTQMIDKFISFYGYSKKEDLYYAFAVNQIELPENPKKILKEKSGNFFIRYMKHAFGSNKEGEGNPEIHLPSQVLSPEENKIDKKKTYTLKEEDFRKNYVTDSCCSPIPGDDVLGFIRDDGRLQIHKIACPQALTLKARFGNRIVSCNWAGHKTFSFPATIEVKGIDRMGILNDMIQVISNDLSVNVRKLLIESKDNFFMGQVEVAVHDVDDIHTLLNRLQKIKGVKSVTRVDKSMF